MKTGLVALCLCLSTTGAALAEPAPAGCAVLAAGLKGIGGWTVTFPLAGSDDGWCIFDGAAFNAVSDLPDLKADRLRLRGAVDGDDLVALDINIEGLRLRQSLNATVADDPIREVFRLQSADLALSVKVDPGQKILRIRDLVLVLSGGTEIAVSADIAGAGLSPESLASGRLTALTVDWRLDGRFLRPVMERIGAKHDPEATGSLAVDATRSALRRVTDALPDAILSDDSRSALDRAVTALPVGRGRLQIALAVPDGIGAARLLVAGVADNPLAPETLALLFEGAMLDVTWEPGLAP